MILKTWGINFTIVLIIFLFSSINALADSCDFIFETNAVRYVLGGDGVSKSLFEKRTKTEYLGLKKFPFASIKRKGKLFQISRLKHEGDIYRAIFDKSGIEADFKIVGRDDCIIVELVHIYGEGVEEVRLAQLSITPMNNSGSLLAVRWNDKFAISLMGLSDRVNSRFGEDNMIVASVFPEFGMEGEKVAIMAVPTPRFLTAIQKFEHDFHLPSPTIKGQWIKLSPDLRESYLFTDLTEANADATIQYAKLAGFKYILVYSGTWSSSLGSYPVNNRNFPDGEKGLKAVIDKCHAAGLKVGMHMLTSFVGKNDPLVRPKPDNRLLKDAEVILATEIDGAAHEFSSTGKLDAFPRVQTPYASPESGIDIQIDDEIIHCHIIGASKFGDFQQCLRGYSGTTAGSHNAGAKIYHLFEGAGSYLVDLSTSLKNQVAERLSGLINRCGFDMIYFDGGELNSANGPFWYWVSQQQMAIWQQSRRDLLIQGSGITPWTWHIFGRGTCDDYAAVSPKQWLDYHKISDYWQWYNKSFLPAELGWLGLRTAAPDHPATKPDEVEYYAARMLALDTPVSLETNFQMLKANGRTEEMLEMLGRYERLRLQNKIPSAVKEKLRTGEWHLILNEGKPEFYPISYDAKRMDATETIKVYNGYAPQKFKFRLQAVSPLAIAGNPANIKLMHPAIPLILQPTSPKAVMPGALIERIEFTKPEGEQPSIFMVGHGRESSHVQTSKALDLSTHRALAVRVKVDGTPPKQGQPCAVLNIQLEGGGKTYRDHYIDLDFIGERTIIVAEPNTERMLPEFRPAAENYAFKAAMNNFNYKNIVAVNLRWMRQLPQPSACSINFIEALMEEDSVLKNPEIFVGTVRVTIPVTLSIGDYAEYWGEGAMRIFDRNGILLSTVKSLANLPELPSGESRVRLNNYGGAAKLTIITLGEAVN